MERLCLEQHPQYGNPLNYQQSFDASWQLPINKLPVFDWVTSDVKYAATYNWERGADLDDGTQMAGTIANSRTTSANVRMKFETLYNHVPFLKKVNRKFASSFSTVKPTMPKKFVKEIQLKQDTTLVVQHGQKSKRLRVVAIRQDGSRYALKYKVLDNNKIEISSRDTTHLKLTVTSRRNTEDQRWYKALQFGTRMLMMVRSVNVSYTNRYNMTLPGFMPRVVIISVSIVAEGCSQDSISLLDSQATAISRKPCLTAGLIRPTA